MRVVFDTQIYIRALQPQQWSVEYELLQLWADEGRFELFISEAQIEEIPRVSRRKIARERIGSAKFGALVNPLRTKTIVLDPKNIPFVVAADPDDDFIVAVALEAKAQILVAHDKHLNPLKRIGKTQILLPEDAFRKL